MNTTQTSFSQIISSKQNLASVFFNALVNCGFGHDKLVSEDTKWFTKYENDGLLSAIASLGLINLWDVEVGLCSIDKYAYSDDDNLKSGALLAYGIVTCRVQNDFDPVLFLLRDYVSHKTTLYRLVSIVGLGLAYAGRNRKDVVNLISNALKIDTPSMELFAFACLSIGVISVGSCKKKIIRTFLTLLVKRSKQELNGKFGKFIALAIGLLFLGKSDAVEEVLKWLEVFYEPWRSFARILVECCAYSGTGNVLKIQQMLHICSEYLEQSSENNDNENDEMVLPNSNHQGTIDFYVLEMNRYAPVFSKDPQKNALTWLKQITD
ncbi:unnamed protein product [Didymodactylos carnosus]|uniref:Uncharacterized protein n=1 Tax=Didymodactylos carnosus TaxID=1234261 RepID=A0A8S2FVV4_9BILA|nr:unnamed protein product [Didymodactylos carnosus]CAF4368862.1 unnamed protein product [Didymodactylos carnosus]